MDANLIPLLPAAQVLVTALVVLMRDLFIKEHEPKGILALLSLVGLGLAFGEAMLLWGANESAFNDSIMLDNFALFFTMLFVAVAGLTMRSACGLFRGAGRMAAVALRDVPAARLPLGAILAAEHPVAAGNRGLFTLTTAVLTTHDVSFRPRSSNRR